MTNSAWVMKPTATRAYFRQLCCLGLGAQIVVPELLRILGRVIPSGPNVFIGVTPTDTHDHIILENPLPEVLELLAREFHTTFQREFSAHTDWWRHHPGSVSRHPEAIYPNIYRSDLYHLVWRPLGQHHALEVQIREGGRLLGHLILFRAADEHPFITREADKLVELLPYVAHSLHTRPSLNNDAFVSSGHHGHILVEDSGRISHQSNTAKQLLYLATHPQIRISQPPPPPRVTLAPLFKKLAGELSAIAHGQAASPPVFSLSTPWGRLIFRAYRLEEATDGPNRLTLIAIEHQEPLPLRLMRGLRSFPLSTKERETCFWLVQGHSHTEVAERLSVQPCTVKQYIDAAYLKLDVHNRTALLQKIMAEAESE